MCFGVMLRQRSCWIGTSERGLAVRTLDMLLWRVSWNTYYRAAHRIAFTVWCFIQQIHGSSQDGRLHTHKRLASLSCAGDSRSPAVQFQKGFVSSTSAWEPQVCYSHTKQDCSRNLNSSAMNAMILWEALGLRIAIPAVPATSQRTHNTYPFYPNAEWSGYYSYSSEIQD